MKKIYSELTEEELDNIKIPELREVIGWVESNKSGTWTVTLAKEGVFHTCKDQTQAEILAGIEEIKAKLFKRN